jgi:hypothetical protein
MPRPVVVASVVTDISNDTVHIVSKHAVAKAGDSFHGFILLLRKIESLTDTGYANKRLSLQLESDNE